MRKDLRRLFRRLRQQGWRMQKRKGGHWCLIPPEGTPIFTGSTPSDVRAMRNLRAQLRRAGAEL